ncbi:MAG TPA: hypothetical protein PLL78_01580 [Fimbriimonadaceae bacterium]|nr:hypothetical protein [Fimbriimonadaceae bacterium]HRJ95350.1 hypothetical protein [Fimbriimonadaceae bacterium]
MRILALAFFALPSLALADVHYTLRTEPASQTIRVSVRMDDAAPNTVFRIPAWCPGFYSIKAYQEKISDVRAVNGDGKALEIRRPDERAWQVANERGPITLNYSVLGDDGGLGFFGVNVRGHTAFVNGPAAFMYADGRKDERMLLTVVNPPGWDTAVSLDRTEAGAYVAADYDELLDSPIRVGKFERRSFNVNGTPFEAIYASTNQRYNPDLEEQTKMLATISAPAMALFGSPPPFKRYLYFVNLAVGDFGGGLEHRASTVLAMPNVRNLQMETLAAHEFVHAWNVKQMRPLPLGPFDYTKPCRTGNLWLAEGVTDYYAQIVAYRSGLFDEAWLLRSLSDNIQELQRGSTRLKVTLEECSNQAWEHGGFSVGDLSYYTKGLVAGFVLDAAIRGATDGKKSLDDTMRSMFAKYRLPLPGYPEDGPRQAVNETAGKDLSALYDVLVRSTKEVPYEELAAMGLRALAPNKEVETLGFSWSGDKVTSVGPGALLVQVGDQIVLVDGQPFVPGAFSGKKQTYRLTVERDGVREEIDLQVAKQAARRWTLERDPFADAAAIARLEGWLKR